CDKKFHVPMCMPFICLPHHQTTGILGFTFVYLKAWGIRIDKPCVELKPKIPKKENLAEFRQFWSVSKPLLPVSTLFSSSRLLV
ncbi:MAG: hypothetical protein AAFQ89_18695, partial [Cyanobacteria bacterium J06626_18]